MLKTYFDNTSSRADFLECFKIERKADKVEYNPRGLDNKKLLFHGSLFSNFVGILSNGMRMPQWKGLFGAGVYFADLAQKSQGYARPYSSNGTALFLVAEVALGTPQNFKSSNSNADKLAPGTHSTHGHGTIHPDPKDYKTIDGDVTVPMGKPVKFDGNMGANEFIVYNTNQIRMRYIIKWKQK